jgi:hypothetical protein
MKKYVILIIATIPPKVNNTKLIFSDISTILLLKVYKKI